MTVDTANQLEVCRPNIKALILEIEMPIVIQASWITPDGTLYASSFNKIYKTADKGLTFQQLRQFDSQGMDTIFVSTKNAVFTSPGLNASEAEAGLWRSTNSGLNWTKVLSLPKSSSAWSIDEDTSGRLFVGVYTRGPIKNARIYRSLDNGTTWSLVYNDSKARHIHYLAVDKKNNYVYASVGDKFVQESNVAYILRSTDGGRHWERILKHMPQIVAIEIIPGARLFGSDDVGNGELFMTSDDKNYQKVLDTGGHSCGFWIRQDKNSRRIYASFVSGEAANKISGIFTSDDNGLSWSMYRAFPTNLPYEGSSRSSNFQNGTLYYSIRLDGAKETGYELSFRVN